MLQVRPAMQAEPGWEGKAAALFGWESGGLDYMAVGGHRVFFPEQTIRLAPTEGLELKKQEKAEPEREE